MIVLRRSHQRRLARRRDQAVWRTFFPQASVGSVTEGFGTLEVLDEGRLSPGGSLHRRLLRDAEIVTFVREGALAWEDLRGRSGLVRAGEFRRMTAGRGIRHRERNASSTAPAHVFEIWLRPALADLEPSCEQKRFTVAERRGGLCVVGSPDGRRGSLRIHQDALVYSALLDPGAHVVHELTPGRSAWLHVVLGEATLGRVVLGAGDGVGLTEERGVSLTARERTEVLFLDLGGEAPARVAA